MVTVLLPDSGKRAFMRRQCMVMGKNEKLNTKHSIFRYHPESISSAHHGRAGGGRDKETVLHSGIRLLQDI